MAGTPSVTPRRGVEVRPLVEDDIPACEELCFFVHGFERTRELRDALAAPGLNPYVALREGRIVAYAATLDEFGAAYAVAESDDDLAALIAGAVVPDGRRRRSCSRSTSTTCCTGAWPRASGSSSP